MVPDTTSLTTRKDSLIQRVTEAYVRGDLDMPAFELAVTGINACPDDPSLGVLASSLGLALAPGGPPSPIADRLELSCVSGSLRQEGAWVKARRYRLGLTSSTARLDFRGYEGQQGMDLEIELSAISSSVKILVPLGFEVRDQIQGRQSSTVKNRPPEGQALNRVVLTGAIRSSAVKVSYRGPRPRRPSLWARLFLREE